MDRRLNLLSSSLSSPTTKPSHGGSPYNENRRYERKRSVSEREKNPLIGQWFAVQRDVFSSVEKDKDHKNGNVKLLRASKNDLVQVIDCFMCLKNDQSPYIDVQTRTGYKGHIMKKDLGTKHLQYRKFSHKTLTVTLVDLKNSLSSYGKSSML